MPSLTTSITVYGFLDNLRNRLKVEDGFREIRIDDRAKAKEDDITEKLLKPFSSMS